MSETITAERRIAPPAEAHWGAVWALSLTVVCLVTAELLPISLLTPMAADLGVSEGMAGQAVSATSVIAMFASLFIAATTRSLDRRFVLLVLTVFYVISNIFVGLASNYAMLLVGRLLLGAAIGGFWSMSAAIALRLVPSDMIPRALSIIFGGVSVAMIIAGPVGSFSGDLIGWRWVFFLAAVAGIAAFVWQLGTLPAMRPTTLSSLKTLFRLLARPQVGLGIAAATLVNGGHFAFFTYLRPFLETVTGVDVNGVSLMLLGFGIANIVGTAISGWVVQVSLKMAMAIVPLTMAILTLLLALFGEFAPLTALAVAAWGFAFGFVPVAWMTWLTRNVPDETESAGGLHVAAIQLSIRHRQLNGMWNSLCDDKA